MDLSFAQLSAYFGARAVESEPMPPRFADRVRRWSATELPRSDAAAVALFQELAQRAVARSIPGSGVVGVSLSGGLDSTLIAAIAAQQLREQGRTLHAYSYVFDRFPSIDERAQIRPLVDHAAIRWTPFAADGLTPFCDPGLRPIDPHTPIATIYREFKTRLYQLAQADGVSVLLSGNFGDHLFANPAHRLHDEFGVGGIRYILRESAQIVARQAKFWRDPAVRYVARRLLRLPHGRAIPPEWLTSAAQTAWSTAAERLPPDWEDARRPDHVRVMLGRYADYDDVLEAPYLAPHGLSLHCPWRDPELSGLMLGLPSRFHHRQGHSKWLMREAAQRWLPDSLRLRPKSASLVPFFHSALRGPARHAFAERLFANGALWPQFVKPAYVQTAWSAADLSDRQALVLWLCAYFEHWRLARCGRDA